MTPDQTTRMLDVIRWMVRRAPFVGSVRSVLEEEGLAVFNKLVKSPFPVNADPIREASARVGCYLDTETSGIDVKQHGVTQLALLRFRFDDQGIVSIDDVAWTRFNDPGCPIEPEVTAITGITDEMVAGKSIPIEDIREQLKGVELITAHKSNFDRPFVEKAFPEAGFDEIPWFCTLEDVNWAARGYAGRSLEILSLKDGWVYAAHDAQADVMAGSVLLASTRGKETPVVHEMIEAGSVKRLRIVAVNSPYDGKDQLKGRGYRWDPDGGETGHVKAWWADITDKEETVTAEREFLRTIYGANSSQVLPAYRISPLNRFSSRTRALPDRFPIQAPLQLKPVIPATVVGEPEMAPA